MSERGSFVTEYIGCSECWECAKRILLERDKYLCSTVIPGWGNSDEIPVIAGKIGSGWAGGEVFMFENDLIPQLEEVICHPMRIAVLGETGQEIFTAMPKESK